MKFKHFAYTVLLLAFWISGFCIGYGWEGRFGSPVAGPRKHNLGDRREYADANRTVLDLNDIPTVEEQIKFLESKEYDCGEPKDKAGPRFCEALERYECDQYAAQWFENQSKKENANGKNNE